MNALYLKEDDVRALAPMPDVIESLAEAFHAQASGKSFNNPRNRLRMPGSTLHIMAGAIPGYFGYKAYTSAMGGARFLFFLFQAGSTELLSIMEADALGQIRTGAATGLATRLMSNPDASVATLFGAGWQAQTQLLAMDAVRNLKEVRIISRKKEKRDAFIQKLQPLVKTELVGSDAAEESVRGSDIVTTMTSSKEPVVKGEWLQPGTHVNAAGGNLLLRREIDDEAVMRASRVVVDSIEHAKIEAGEFVTVLETGRRHWEDFIELRDVVAGFKSGRTAREEITLFKSMGLAIEDVAIGKLVYERAVAARIGHRLEL